MIINLGVVLDIAVAALVTDLLLLVGHWFRWDLWFGKELPRIAAYVYGMLAVLAPITVVLVIWQMWIVVVLVWTCAITGGMAVCVAYFIDDHVVLRKKDQVSMVEREILNGAIEKNRQ